MDDPDRQPGQTVDDNGGQSGTQYSDDQSIQQYDHEHQQHLLGRDEEEVVQVVYQRDQHGSLVGVESTSLLGSYNAQVPASSEAAVACQQLSYVGPSLALGADAAQVDGSSSQMVIGAHQQLSRAASTLPSVAEESTSSGQNGAEVNGTAAGFVSTLPQENEGQILNAAPSNQYEQHGDNFDANQRALDAPNLEAHSEANFQPPIYSTVEKHSQGSQNDQEASVPLYAEEGEENAAHAYQGDVFSNQAETYSEHLEECKENLSGAFVNYHEQDLSNTNQRDELLDESMQINQEISQIIGRQKTGGVEKGSFRHNFRKKLGLSVSTNENDLTAYRQKFIEQVQDEDKTTADELEGNQQLLMPAASHKFKRTHSVSFNVNSSRGNRHSVDIRNLPSYLTHKRASIVDVAKGAMSSLISSLGGGGGGASSNTGSVISSSQRRESLNYDVDYEDNEPIFEEPIAPTLSLGQRVAMVRNSGTEFGTVGWIGQLPDVDDDWIVGVIFDNMIGDCDGAYRGTRYFYAREGYAMFVPLSVLTKTDNYIGRPETGTVLSRMSVSLKPGQLISIQRSSIRLQHCFLNAPHQRVGHDVRAVSNRLHCQCHNCGPCAHLTKQGRPHVLPHFGAHHLPIKKKNSLAHAAVEMLAHHHHHFHEEEEHEEKDYEFGDNAAHACNFVRYSCCQQSGQPGHEFSTDCGMVRPELLDNLIHAPKAPHRRSRPRRRQHQQALRADDRAYGSSKKRTGFSRPNEPAELGFQTNNTNTLETNQSAIAGTLTMTTSTLRSTTYQTSELTNDQDVTQSRDDHESDNSRASSCFSSNSASGSSSASSSRSSSPSRDTPSREPYNYYQYDTSSFRPQNTVYKTIDSQVSIVDQQRFVFRRDSSAFIQSAPPSNWSDEQESDITTLGLGARLMRCLGCLKKRAGGNLRSRRKLSFKDKVLEYRRRQSTFVPSTLAKPHEDFASHGIMFYNQQYHSAFGMDDPNSDYSSCSKSSGSSRSNSPHRGPDMAGTVVVADVTLHNQSFQQQADFMTLEHGYPSSNGQLKSGQWVERVGDNVEEEYKRQLNYGDFNFSDGYDTYKRHEFSKDSALTDLANYSDTYKTDSSSDTLKYLIDQSINEQVMPPQPMLAHQIAMSPISSSGCQEQGEPNGSTTSEHLDISSPTASVNDPVNDDDDDDNNNNNRTTEEIRADFEHMQLEHESCPCYTGECSQEDGSS